MLGLPDDVRACLFDLDGVLTSTAVVHAAAWKEMFDAYLRRRADRTGDTFVPFTIDRDYVDHVDGKPRDDGTRDFLASRGIVLSEAETGELGRAKNEIVQRLIREGGVHAYPGSVDYLRMCRDAGLARVVVSSSANCRQVLVAAGLLDLVDGYVDGIVARQRGLRGKPAADTFLAGAALVGATAGTAAVFEDAVAGVDAGRAGDFRYVVGVDRVGHAGALMAHGADVVVADLSELATG